MENVKDIWKFKDVGKRNLICYSEESIRHPAKMELNMCRKIIKLYTKPGELILDPMAGIGSTIIEGMILGRNVIGIEYEKKFAELTQKNIKKTKDSLKFMNSLGKGQVIKGDSRELSKLLSDKADKILFRPPFANENKGSGIAKRMIKREKNDDDTYGGMTQAQPLSSDKDNIDNIKNYGSADTIITSPPYGHESTTTRESAKDKRDIHASRFNETNYSDDNDNIGNMTYNPEVDTILTSPPFEDSNPCADKDKGTEQKKEWEKNQVKGGSGFLNKIYSENSDNIGNKKGKNYLSEMMKIYKQCYSILKLEGHMILVTKNFVRNGQQIRLDLDTIKLYEAAGFKYHTRHYRKINNPSFWITNAIQKYEEKHPGEQHPYPLEEDVLVFKK